MRWDRLVFIVFAGGMLPATGVAVGLALTADEAATASIPAEVASAPASPRPSLEDRLWCGREVSRRFRDVAALPHSVVAGTPEPDRVDAVLEALGGLPPAVRRRLAEFGGGLVFHAGPVTGLPECADLKGRKCGLYKKDDMSWDEVAGLYRPGSQRAFVCLDSGPEWARHVLLHELGHMCDDACGDLSQDHAWQVALAADDAQADLGYAEHIDFDSRKRCEYFADAFSWYHSGVEARMTMRHMFPAATAYMDDLTERVSRASMALIEEQVRVALRRRLRARGRGVRAVAVADVGP